MGRETYEHLSDLRVIGGGRLSGRLDCRESLRSKRMSPGPVKLLIVDQSLRDLSGHHFEYDVSVARAAMGLAVPVIASHVECDLDASCGDIPIRKHFTKAWNEVHQDIWTRGARQVLSAVPRTVRAPVIRAASTARGILRPERHSIAPAPGPLSFGAELRNLIAKERLGVRDHVLVHTLSVAELHALTATCAGLDHSPTFHVVLRRDAEEPAVRADGGISGVFKNIGDSLHLMERVRFWADTEHLRRQYEFLSGVIPVRLLPIPHQLPDWLDPDKPRQAGPIRVTYLGDARTEKGFHYLPDLVDVLKATLLDVGKARFVIQANSSLSLEDAIISAARRRLSRYHGSQVELLDEALSMDEFQRRLLAADIVLLPYSADLYRRRSSGIMVQALVAGRPVVVPDGTWMADCAPTGSAIAFGEPDDLATAVVQAVEALPSLTRAARASAGAWRQEHNARSLVQCLLQ